MKSNQANCNPTGFRWWVVHGLVQIITVFSCKLQGKRTNKVRKLVKELIEEGGEDNDKNNSSNAAPKQQTEN